MNAQIRDQNHSKPKKSCEYNKQDVRETKHSTI